MSTHQGSLGLKRLLGRWLPSGPSTRADADVSVELIDDAPDAEIEIADLDALADPEQRRADPTQQSMDAMFARATRIRVIEGGVQHGRAEGAVVLLDCDDAASIGSLRARLAILEDPRTFGHDLSPGDHAIECYAGRELLATIGLHNGKSIRWNVWAYDAQLRDGQALLAWLVGRGVAGPLQAYRRDEQRSREAQENALRWQRAMPECLRSHWPEMYSQVFNFDLKPLRRALEKAYPNRIARARALLEWFGSGAGPWSGFPSYEDAAEQLLLDFPTRVLVTAITDYTPSEAQLEGAARYFSGRRFREKKGLLLFLPARLKRFLLTHSLASSNGENIERARRAFG